MRIGILPERIYTRSVERIVHKYNKDKGTACMGTGCALLCIKVARLSGISEYIALEIAEIANEIWIDGLIAAAGKPARMQAIISLPEQFEEQDLRSIVSEIVVAADNYNLYIADVQVRTECDLRSPQIVFSLMGEPGEQSIKSLREAGDSRQAIIQIGYAGAAGSRYLANRFEDMLSDRYSKNYIRKMQSAGNELNIEGAINTLRKTYGNQIIFLPIGEGGVYASLWNLGQQLRTGLSIDLKAIPIKQETIELCDIVDVNPYMLYSSGSVLAVISEDEDTLSNLRQKGMPINIIGYLTSDNDRVIINGEEKKFLTEPVEDEIYKVITKITN